MKINNGGPWQINGSSATKSLRIGCNVKKKVRKEIAEFEQRAGVEGCQVYLLCELDRLELKQCVQGPGQR